MPEIQDITWDEAVILIRTKQAIDVNQYHSLTVMIVTADGKSYRTVESKIDAVFDLVREVDPDGDEINVDTE